MFCPYMAGALIDDNTLSVVMDPNNLNNGIICSSDGGIAFGILLGTPPPDFHVGTLED